MCLVVSLDISVPIFSCFLLYAFSFLMRWTFLKTYVVFYFADATIIQHHVTCRHYVYCNIWELDKGERNKGDHFTADPKGDELEYTNVLDCDRMEKTSKLKCFSLFAFGSK